MAVIVKLSPAEKSRVAPPSVRLAPDAGALPACTTVQVIEERSSDRFTHTGSSRISSAAGSMVVPSVIVPEDGVVLVSLEGHAVCPELRKPYRVTESAADKREDVA